MTGSCFMSCYIFYHDLLCILLYSCNSSVAECLVVNFSAAELWLYTSEYKSVQIIIQCCPYVLICTRNLKMAHAWPIGLKPFFNSVTVMHISNWQGHCGINMQ